jgi:transmembrane sensor
MFCKSPTTTAQPLEATVNNKNNALEQAADWQLRLQEEPRARAEFERWLNADPAHTQAWRKMQQLWGALGELAPVAEPVPVETAARPTPRRWWPALAAAASVAAIAVLIAPQASLALRADYQTGIGETREVHLPDGSSVTLAPDSAMAVASNNPRQVELLRGQAYFQVAPDPQHPFTAKAGQLSVRVLGTAFDLDLQPASAEVALEHGQVQAENTRADLSERLAPGQRLKLNWPSGTVERSQLAPQQVAAWRSGSLFVENQSVADIVAHLQRYTSGWIVVPDANLKQRRITGLFDLSNPDRALQALATSLGVKTHQVTPWVHSLGSF